MKTLKILFSLFILLILNSCSKEDEIVENESKTVVNLYSNTPNLLDGIQADVFIPNENANVFFYGDFDSFGIPNTYKSISIKTGNDLLNILFDDNLRVKLSFKSHSDGTKENYIIKYDYPTNNNIKVSFYEYNWQNNTDKLLYQNIVNDTNGILTGNVTYAGKSSNSDNFFNVDKRIQLKNAIKKAGEVVSFALGAGAIIAVPVVVVAAVSAGVFGIPTGAAIIIAEIAFLSLPSNASEIKQNINLNYPTSPTSGTVPNPMGTPQNPNGSVYSILVSNWNYYYNFQGNEFPYNQWFLLNGNYQKINGNASIISNGNVNYQRTFSWYSASTPNIIHNTVVTFNGGKLTGILSGTNMYEVNLSQATLNIVEDGVQKQCQPSNSVIRLNSTNFIDILIQYSSNGQNYAIRDDFKRN